MTKGVTAMLNGCCRAICRVAPSGRELPDPLQPMWRVAAQALQRVRANTASVAWSFSAFSHNGGRRVESAITMRDAERLERCSDAAQRSQKRVRAQMAHVADTEEVVPSR
jgi:hypothetical protein